jgi:hypothetical protein
MAFFQTDGSCPKPSRAARDAFHRTPVLSRIVKLFNAAARQNFSIQETIFRIEKF